MRKGILLLSILMTVSLAADGVGRSAERRAPEGFGQSYDEIVALAKKEGKVRFASSDPDEKDATRFFRPFEEKYGIKVDYSRARGTESRERILLELMAGRVEYDLLHISAELVPNYKKADALAGPFDWQGLFDIKPVFIAPDKIIIVAGSSASVITYNPDLVPKDRIPRRWEDFLDPYWKGKFAIDTRSKTFVHLYPTWGKKKLLDFCRALAANKPVWEQGMTATLVKLAAGEYPAMCGSYMSSAERLLERDPNAKLAISIPTEVPTEFFAKIGVLKAAKYPNAALLLGGWLAAAEGQKQYDVVAHRGSPFIDGTLMARSIKAAGAKIVSGGWEYTMQEQAEVTAWILEAWGFPTGKSKKKAK